MDIIVKSVQEQTELLKPFVNLISQIRKICGFNPADNYFYRIIQAADLLSTIDSSIVLGRPRPCPEYPNDYTNSRTSFGEGKSCYVTQTKKGRCKNGKFEFTNQNMPEEQEKFNSYESFLFSVNNVNEEILFVMYLNNDVSVNAFRQSVHPKQKLIQERWDEKRGSNMRPSIMISISDVLNIPNCRIVNNQRREISKDETLLLLGWKTPDNPFFGTHA